MQVKAYKETNKVSSNTQKKDYIINIFVIKKQGSKERHGKKEIRILITQRTMSCLLLLPILE
jgi:hypothetical protein